MFFVIEFQTVGIGYGVITSAIHHGCSQYTRQIALRASRFEPVWCAKDVAEAGDAPDLRIAASAGRAEDILCTEIFFDLHQFISDHAQRFIPGCPAESSAASFANADQRVFVSVWMI